NTLLIIVMCFIIIFSYGFLIDNSVFRIPAGAALMLILSVAIAIACVISYWAGGWRVIVFALLIFVLNFISGFDMMMYKHEMIGLKYKNTKIEYNNQS